MASSDPWSELAAATALDAKLAVLQRLGGRCAPAVRPEPWKSGCSAQKNMRLELGNS